MLIKVHKSDTPSTIALGSHILTPMLKELKNQDIEVVKIYRTRQLYAQHRDMLPSLLSDCESTFRNMPESIGNICAITAKASANDMRMLARQLCSQNTQIQPRTGEALNVLLIANGISI